MRNIVSFIFFFTIPLYCYEKIFEYNLENCTINSMSWSPDETLLACSLGSTIKIFNIITKEIIELNDHENHVNIVLFSPDGKFLASGSDDMTIKIWDTTNWNCIKNLIGHTNSVDCLTFSNDGFLLASGSRDATIKIWYSLNWKCINILKQKAYIDEITFAQDEQEQDEEYKRKLITYSKYNQYVKIWNFIDRVLLNTINYNNQIHKIVISRDLAQKIEIYKNKTRIVNLKTNEKISKLKKGISCASFSQNGSKVRYNIRNKIFICPVSSLKKEPIIKTQDNILALAWSNNENQVAVNLNSKLEVWTSDWQII